MFTVSAPAIEPFDVAYVKNYLKVSATADDVLIADLIIAARQYVERITGRMLFTVTVTEYFDCWPDSKSKDARTIELVAAPVQSVTSVSYIAEDAAPGVYTLLDAALYVADVESGQNQRRRSRVVRDFDVLWPQTEGYVNAVKVVYVAGYGDIRADVPGPLMVAMLRLIGVWYEGRDWKNINEFGIIESLITPYILGK